MAATWSSSIWIMAMTPSKWMIIMMYLFQWNSCTLSCVYFFILNQNGDDERSLVCADGKMRREKIPKDEDTLRLRMQDRRRRKFKRIGRRRKRGRHHHEHHSHESNTRIISQFENIWTLNSFGLFSIFSRWLMHGRGHLFCLSKLCTSPWCVEGFWGQIFSCVEIIQIHL